MKVRIINLTESIINFNKCGIPLRGREEATVEIDNEGKKNEIMGIQRAGLIDVEAESPELPNTEEREATPEEIKAVQDQLAQSANDPNLTLVTGHTLEIDNKTGEVTKVDNVEAPKAKNKGGRPKGSKNKKGTKSDQQRVIEAEAKTQQMGGRVVIATVDGLKEGRMTRSVIDDLPESDRTRASLEAMEKLQREEEEEISLPDTLLDENTLPPNEQMGRKATISTPQGDMKIDLVNSVVPESKQSREANPFIDRPLDASEQAGRKATVMTEEGGKKVAMVNSVVPEAKQSQDAAKPIDRSSPEIVDDSNKDDDDGDYSEAFVKDL